MSPSRGRYRRACYGLSPERVRQFTLRYSLAYSRLHGLVTKVNSKSHGALMRLLGSRFTEVSVPNSMLVSSYVLSTRV